MRWRSVLAVILAPAAAIAQPVEEPEAYPRALVLRPILLPEGALETALGASAAHRDGDTPGFVDAYFGYRFHAFELGLGATVQALESPPSGSSRIRSINASAFRSFIPQLAGGLFVDLGDALTVNVVLSFKQPLVNRVAIIATAYGGYHTWRPIDPMTMEVLTVNGSNVGGSAGAQLQLTSLLGLEATGTGSYSHYDDELIASGGSLSAGTHVVASITSSIDLRAGLRTYFAGDDRTSVVFVSALYRRL